MSDLDEKLERTLETGGAARRPYHTLVCVRGFRMEARSEGRVVLSISPMTRSYWRHDGRGRWDSADAMYEQIDPGEVRPETGAPAPEPVQVKRFAKGRKR